MAVGLLTAQAVADLVGGRLLGDGGVSLVGIAPLDRAGPTELSFLAAGRYADAFRVSRAGAVFVTEADAGLSEGPETRIVVSDPHRALATVAGRLYPASDPVPGIHPTAVLGVGIRLGHGVTVGPGVVLGNEVVLGDHVVLGPGVVLDEGVVIGEASQLGAHVVLGPRVRIGRRVTIKAGAVLGGTGFGYVSGPEGHERIPHVGTVVVGDDVDIGSNVTIDRGSVGDTEVGSGTKIDNLVQLGHNVRVGARCLLMAGVGVAGSTQIGDGVILAGHVGVIGHVTLGTGARIGAGSKVYSSVPAGAKFSGFPARSHLDFLRAQAALYRLMPLVSDLEALVTSEKRPHDA